MEFKEFDYMMTMALEEAEKAYHIDEVPIGAVIVDASGKVLAKFHNLKEKTNNPCGHAEILTIQAACEEIEDWRLDGCTLFVTLEPCLMCMGAILQCRIKRLVFGAYDPKGGALSLGYTPFRDNRLNHQFEVVGGIKHYECSRTLSEFFRQKRLKSS